jgi:hypothetical protein
LTPSIQNSTGNSKAWETLIVKTFSIIRIGAESFERDSPYRVEEVMRSLLEGYFLPTDMKMDTFREDAEQGIVEFLEYICHGPSIVTGLFQNLVGQLLHQMVGISSWKCLKMQGKIARCQGVADGFIQRTIDSNVWEKTVLQMVGEQHKEGLSA